MAEQLVCIQGESSNLQALYTEDQPEALEVMVSRFNPQADQRTNDQCVYLFECPAVEVGCRVKLRVKAALGRIPVECTTVNMPTCRATRAIAPVLAQE